MPSRIKDKDLSDAICGFISTFLGQANLESVPKSVQAECFENMIDSIILETCNLNGGERSDKVSGKVKVYVLNSLRVQYGLEFTTKQSVQVSEWEAHAFAVYNQLYRARCEPDILVEGASRLMRELSIFTSLAPGSERVHYRPNKEILKRFYTKVWNKEFGEVGQPVAFAESQYITDMDGVVYVHDMIEAHISQYNSGELPNIPTIDLEKL